MAQVQLVNGCAVLEMCVEPRGEQRRGDVCGAAGVMLLWSGQHWETRRVDMKPFPPLLS